MLNSVLLLLFLLLAGRPASWLPAGCAPLLPAVADCCRLLAAAAVAVATRPFMCSPLHLLAHPCIRFLHHSIAGRTTWPARLLDRSTGLQAGLLATHSLVHRPTHSWTGRRRHSPTDTLLINPFFRASVSHAKFGVALLRIDCILMVQLWSPIDLPV